ncbi:O-antigen ligase family protein [Aureimonas flava]|uniref:O-antigen ligase family protein n=1 Tax=Aureimonas flava TaxID=2320271 RepID=A0A3A1WID5_9HYPH|nr:O-antigen ligase [Aureimonas flava]RIX98417.1 O-antigen ligase family protein [Aureimonas flava]
MRHASLSHLGPPGPSVSGPPTGALGIGEARALKAAISALILTMLLVTFEPYQAVFTGPAGSGNLVNQLGYGGLGLASILIHACVTPRAVVARLLRPSWMVMALVLLLSSTQSIWPDSSFRAVVFSLAAMLAMTGALCLAPDERAFRFALATAALAVLGLSYAGVVLMPAAAIHNEALEAANIGLWRGIYSHKNVAGPVMAVLCFAGLYLVRSGQWVTGIVIAVLAAFFVLKTGSKTTLGLMPLVALLVSAGRVFGGRRLPTVVLALALSCAGLMTLGTVLSPLLYDLLQWAMPGTTFTGRLDLWRFAIHALGPRAWTGAGFEAFWTTPAVMQAELPFGSSWDPRGIVNAHNGYLDLAIALGWPGLAIGVLVLAVLPLRDFARVDARTPEATRAADFFLMVLTFTLLNAFLESFLFARGNPVWMVMWLAVAGLHLLPKASMHAQAVAGELSETRTGSLRDNGTHEC